MFFLISILFEMFPYICVAIAIYNGIRFFRMLNAKPTPMICPNCNSEDVAFQNVNSGAGTVSVGGVVSVGAAKINNKHVAVCRRCGHTFNYMTRLDIQETKKRSLIFMIVGIILWILSLFM